MWFIHPVESENIIIRGVTVIGDGPNNDGCNPESCKDVLIEECYFKTGDDCIAIKSGRNNDGRRIGKPSENIVVRNCKMDDGHGGVVIGSEISGGCRNVFVEDCKMDSPNLLRAIRIKTNKHRGGTIQNIYVRNVTIGEVSEAVLRINLKYDSSNEGQLGSFLPIVKNIFLSDVTSEKSKYGIYVEGLENSKIKNIALKNCSFNSVFNGNIIKNIDGLVLNNFYINDTTFKFTEESN
jgi:polygalacturonase